MTERINHIYNSLIDQKRVGYRNNRLIRVWNSHLFFFLEPVRMVSYGFFGREPVYNRFPNDTLKWRHKTIAGDNKMEWHTWSSWYQTLDIHVNYECFIKNCFLNKLSLGFFLLIKNHKLFYLTINLFFFNY